MNTHLPAARLDLPRKRIGWRASLPENKAIRAVIIAVTARGRRAGRRHEHCIPAGRQQGWSKSAMPLPVGVDRLVKLNGSECEANTRTSARYIILSSLVERADFPALAQVQQN
jgi:hypothetical protein